MTTFKAPVRDYKFTDARLVEITLEKAAFAVRDATELLTKGITATFVSDLQASSLTFGAMPSDDVELGEQQEATSEKDSDADSLRDKLKELRSSATRAFGNKSGTYNQFGLKSLDDCNDSDLLRVGLVAHGVAVTYATELTAKGYTAADNTALASMITTYVSGLQNQSMEIGSRDNAQEARVLAGNTLYNLLENELCEAAKSYWRTRSASKYNDYIIYNTIAGSAVPQTVNFTVNGLSSFTLVTIDYRPNRHFTIHNTSPVPYYLFLSNDGITALNSKILIGSNATLAGLWSDLGPSGAMAVVGNDNPGMIGTGTFTYDV